MVDTQDKSETPCPKGLLRLILKDKSLEKSEELNDSDYYY